MIKICHLTTAHPSGDARIFHKECKTLARAGYDVTLIARHPVRAQVDGVRIEPLSPAGATFYRRMCLQPQVLKVALRARADVYHIHDPELLPIGAALGRMTPAKVVYDMHEYYSRALVARYCRGKDVSRRALEFLLEGRVLRAFDLLVFPTVSLQQSITSYSKSVILANLPTIEDPHMHPRALPWTDKEFDVIHLGAVSPPRMRFMMDVIRAASRLRPTTRWLFLGLDAATTRWATSAYERSFLDHHVVMREKVTHLQALALTQLARIGFNYHPFEERFLVALPMKVFEYMLLELPVVSTALPELARYVAPDRDAVLLGSGVPEDYAAAIGGLLGNRDRATALGRQGRARILDEVNWEHSEAPKLLRSYGELLQG